MDPGSLIPSAEVIPAPWWFVEALGVLTLTLHLLVINVVVGGSLLMLVSRLREGTKGAAGWLPDAFSNKLPTAFAIGINLGVAPLLFTQVLYGHFFYSSSIVMAVFWLLVIPLLILAYYGAHLHAKKIEVSRGLAVFGLAVACVIVLYIPFAFENNISMEIQPARWTGYFTDRGGMQLNLSDPVMWARYFHFLAASFAVAGLFGSIVWAIRRKRGADPQAASEKIDRGLRIFAFATMIQVVIGFLLLFVLPREVMMQYMGGNMLYTVMLFIGIILALAVIMTAVLRKLWPTVILAAATVVTMILLRTFLRYAYLEPYFDVSSLEVVPQTALVIVFLVVFVAGLAVVGMMLRWAVAASKGKEASS